MSHHHHARRSRNSTGDILAARPGECPLFRGHWRAAPGVGLCRDDTRRIPQEGGRDQEKGRPDPGAHAAQGMADAGAAIQTARRRCRETAPSSLSAAAPVSAAEHPAVRADAGSQLPSFTLRNRWRAASSAWGRRFPISAMTSVRVAESRSRSPRWRHWPIERSSSRRCAPRHRSSQLRRGIISTCHREPAAPPAAAAPKKTRSSALSSANRRVPSPHSGKFSRRRSRRAT